MRIGIICPSEIAYRRFLPALKKCDQFDYVGVGMFSQEEMYTKKNDNNINDTYKIAVEKEREKASAFVNQFGGKIYESYSEIVTSSEIDAIYIPLPPELHFEWAKKALENGKHVLVEKPATTSLIHTKELIDLANKKQLALHENYMFVFHEQLNEIDRIIKSGEIGDVRLYRVSFGFPRRDRNDFRYNKSLGGGALLDAGGYTIKYATRLLGNTAKLKYAQSNYLLDEFDVDIYGSAALTNDDGEIVQVAFGIDNNYKCELEVWGSKGDLTTGRVLTAPVDYIPSAIIRKNNREEMILLSADDSFLKSIDCFTKCITNDKMRKNNYETIMKQAMLVDQFMALAGRE